MERSRRLTPAVLVEWIVGAAAIAFFALVLSLNYAVPSGGGESRIANAYQTLAALAALWISLFLLLLIDVFRAGRFSWSAGLALVLLPIACVAGLLASDVLHDSLCQLSMALLPLLFGAYLLLPLPGAKPWSGPARALVLLTILALSAYGVMKSLG